MAAAARIQMASTHSPSADKKQCCVTVDASQFAVMSALPSPTSVASLPLIVTTFVSLETNSGSVGAKVNLLLWLQSPSSSLGATIIIWSMKPEIESGVSQLLSKPGSQRHMPSQLKLAATPLLGLYSISLPMNAPLFARPAQSSWPPVTVNGITLPRTSFT